MHILPIIPARFESERFPGKLLKRYCGPTVISWPIAACLAAFQQCFVLTDNTELAEEASAHDADALLIEGDYRNGTERIADACNRLNVDDDTLIMHVQGDEVGLIPEDLKRLAQVVMDRHEVGTLFYRTDDEKLLKSLDHVKCWRGQILKAADGVLVSCGESWRFSRARNVPTHEEGQGFIHVGVYCYRRSLLHGYMARWPTDDEKCERLEQLRWDVPIIAYEVAPCKSINVPEDLEH